MAYAPSTPVTLDALAALTLTPITGRAQLVRADATAGTFTLTLYTPTAALAGATVIVQKTTAANSVTVSGDGTLIDGQANLTLTNAGETVTLTTNGTTWAVAGATNRTALDAQTMRVGALTVAGTTTLSTPLADTNLATVSSAGKVANSATTATDANTASAIVARDASGNFSAGTITAALTGNAATATKLSTSRTFALTGDVTGSVSSDLTSGFSISTTLGASVTAGKATNLAGGAQYSVPYQTGADTTAFVSIGSAGAVLTSNGTASAPSWQTPSTVSASADNITGGAAGDLLYQSAGGTTAKLNIGTTGQVLTVSGGVPAWGTTVANLAGGAANQLPYQSGANTTTFLAAPTGANQYLRWNGSALEWGTVSATAESTKNVIGDNSSGGAAGQIVYQSGASTTAFTATGTSGQLLQSNGSGAPSWITATNTTTANAVAIRNASGQLAGDITGNAATVTNGVVTTGSYSNPGWITGLAGSKISGNIDGNAANVTGTVAVSNGGTGTTSLTGYVYGNGSGAMTASTTIPGTAITGNIDGNAKNITDYTLDQAVRTTSSPSFAGLTVSGTINGTASAAVNGVVTTGSYSDPAWVTALSVSNITGNIPGNASNITAYPLNQSVTTSANIVWFNRARIGTMRTTAEHIGLSNSSVYGGFDNDTGFVCTGISGGSGTATIAGVLAPVGMTPGSDAISAFQGVGTELTLVNVFGGTIDILHDSGSASNERYRILTPTGSTIALTLGKAIRMVYAAQDSSGTNGRWVVLSS